MAGTYRWPTVNLVAGQCEALQSTLVVPVVQDVMPLRHLLHTGRVRGRGTGVGVGVGVVVVFYIMIVA